MRIEIEIPKEFEEHFKEDKFKDSLHRLSADAHLIAGNYEQEVAIMLVDAFEKSKPAYNVDRSVHGEWIDYGTLNDYPEKGVNNYHLLVCSECGCCHRTRLQNNVGKPFNASYCPNCGANMKGGVNHD